MSGDLPKAFNGHRFLKEQLVLSQSAHEKSMAGTSVTVSAPEETMENSVSQDQIHTENTAN